MKIRITAIHPDDAYADGYLKAGQRPSVIGLEGNFTVIRKSTICLGFSSGHFVHPDFTAGHTTFYAIQYQELSDEK